MSNDNSGVLGPAFTRPPAKLEDLPARKEDAQHFVDEMKDLPVGNYEKGVSFTVVVAETSGEIFVIKQHSSKVRDRFAVTPPPTENQVVGL